MKAMLPTIKVTPAINLFENRKSKVSNNIITPKSILVVFLDFFIGSDLDAEYSKLSKIFFSVSVRTISFIFCANCVERFTFIHSDSSILF